MYNISTLVADGLPNSVGTISICVQSSFKAGKEMLNLRLHVSPGIIHFTADNWTSPDNLALIVIISHYVNDEDKLSNDVLGLRKLESKHSGENLRQIFISILDEYNI